MSSTLRDLLDVGRVTLTRSETADILGVDPRTVSAAIDTGDIPAVKYGRRVLVLAVPLARQLGVLGGDDDGGDPP